MAGTTGYGGADVAGYGTEAADLQYRYNTDKAQNAYGRFLSQQRGERSLGEMRTNFNRGLPNVRAGWAHRGLVAPGVQSGAAQRSMANYLGDYTRNYGQAQQDLTADLQNYDLQDRQMDAYYQNSLAALRQRKANDISNAARAIEALRPYFGALGGTS